MNQLLNKEILYQLININKQKISKCKKLIRKQ